MSSKAPTPGKTVSDSGLGYSVSHLFSVYHFGLLDAPDELLSCHLGAVVRAEMRKLLTILALWGFAAGISARDARADGVTYTVNSTYALDTSTSLVSAPDASFMFTFTVPSPCSPSSTPSCSNVSGGVANFPAESIEVTFSSPTLPGFTAPATLSFFSSGGGGLFDLSVPFRRAPPRVRLVIGMISTGRSLTTDFRTLDMIR